MSHTSHPYGMRVGIIRPWKSRWFNRKDYAKLLREDTALRAFLEAKLHNMFVESVEIERSPATLSVIISSARPGLLIGRGGEGIEKLKKEITAFLRDLRKKMSLVRSNVRVRDAKRDSAATRNPELRLTVEEVRFPETHAKVMINQIAQDLEKRLPFRRVLKQSLAKIMASRSVIGAKISLSGRLDGAEMARFEWLKEGKIPLQTLRADIDFARGRAHLPYGDLGIKVWIYRGEIFSKK